MAEESQTEDAMVAALLREREGLVQQGLDDRVAADDEQLAAHGHTGGKSGDKAKAPASRSTPPKARRARGSETT